MRRNTKRTISLLVVYTMLVSTVGFAVPVFSVSEGMNPDNLFGSETSVELQKKMMRDQKLTLTKRVRPRKKKFRKMWKNIWIMKR